jgi:hypothetical protein
MSKRRHRIVMGLWVALLVVVAIVFRDRLFPGDDAPVRPAQVQPDEESRTPRTPSVLTRLVGRWQRSEGGYVLDIKAVHDDGKLDATYLNPRPIHVSQAQALTKGGYVVVVVTLQDRNYPGNMYTLTYDPDADCLEGVYHHRGLGQQFDVVFSRQGRAQDMQE